MVTRIDSGGIMSMSIVSKPGYKKESMMVMKSCRTVVESMRDRLIRTLVESTLRDWLIRGVQPLKSNTRRTGNEQWRRPTSADKRSTTRTTMWPLEPHSRFMGALNHAKQTREV